MNDNHYRTLRLSRVGQALQAAVGQQTALENSRTVLRNDPTHTPQQVDEIDARLQVLAEQRTALEQELAVLQAEDWRTADRTYRAVAADWFWTTPAGTVAQQVAADPVLRILNEPPHLTTALQQQLTAWPRAAGKTPATLWDQVRSLVGGDDDQLDELILTGQRVWMAQDANPRYYFDDVAVLLPVRLETIFKDVPDGELLMIRVIPDEVSIRRDNPQVSPFEAECLRDFWNVVKDAPPAQPAELDQWLQTDPAKVAWNMLAARVEPRRGAWLVGAFPPTFDQGKPRVEIPPERIGDAIPNRIGAWPWEVEVWATLIDEGEDDEEDTVRNVLLGTLAPASDVTPEEREQRLQLPLPENLDAFRNSWWADWDQAKRLGLGGEILLPADVPAAEIDVLSVIGLGDESPDAHFEALASAGQLGVLPVGSPTNSVHGGATAPLATAAETWRDVAAQRLKVASASDADSRVPGWLALEHPLLGSGPALSGVPGSEAGDSLTSHLVRALWPALWGYSLRDLWGLKEAAPLLGLWAGENLHPEGPLPPIRIEDQPYALLPVTALGEWSPDDSGSELSYLEAKMAYGLANLCRDCARRARRANPTIVDADTERLVEVLGRSAVTPKFAYRNFVSTELVALALGVSQEDLEKTFEKDFGAEFDQEFTYMEQILENRPNRYHLALGWPQLLDLPLIAATRRPLDMPLVEMLHRVMQGEQPFVFLHSPDNEISIFPDSLLIRLLLHSLLVGQAWYMQELNGDPEPLLNLPQWDEWDSVIQRKRAGFENAYDPDAPQTNATELFRQQLSSAERLAKMLEADPDWLEKVRDPLGIAESVWRMKIPADLLASYERQFRATLDTASHRIDPWITGIAWRRLKQQTASLNVSRRMGVYGWVDQPLRGEPGPTTAGRLHAPSQAQVLTAALLRDRYLSADRDRQWNASPGGEPAPNVWDMNLDSALIRMACGFAEEARLGCHLYEILGRRVEAIFDTHQQVKILRRRFPLAASGPNPQTVCNGWEALKALLGSGVPVVPVNSRQLEQLQELRRGFDAYADLLVADATHQIMTGHPDRAAEAMDAAAGFSQPPRLEAIRTPPSGYHLATSLVSVLPWIPPPVADSATPPCRIAEPSLTAALSQLFPDVDSYQWQIRYRPIAESPLQTQAISLTALGWNMSAAAVLPEVLVTEALCARIEIELSKGGQIVDVQPPREFTTARQMVLSLGQQPATARTLFNDGEAALADWAQLDAGVKADFTTRLQNLRTVCQQIVDTLEQNNADPAARLTALHQALAWGVVPVTDPIPQQKFYRALFGSAEPVDSEMLDRWAAAAAQELAGRLLRSNKAPVDKLPDLARAIAELATPDGKLAILAGWPKALLRNRARLQIDSPEPALDDDWLSIVAAVRPQAARLEALQLQAMHLHTHTPWEGWTNSTGDPWQTAVVAANLAQRQAATPGSYQTPRFLAAYGPAGAWQGEQVAVGLIDEFSESIPMPQRSTFAAFGFNAPASRPPQAILLAVPPQPGQPLETRVLFQTVFETRDLAHARAARLEDLGNLQALAPSTMFPAAGNDGVFLTPTN